MPVAVESHQPLEVRQNGQRAAASGRDALRHGAPRHSTGRATLEPLLKPLLQPVDDFALAVPTLTRPLGSGIPGCL